MEVGEELSQRLQIRCECERPSERGQAWGQPAAVLQVAGRQQAGESLAARAVQREEVSEQWSTVSTGHHRDHQVGAVCPW